MREISALRLVRLRRALTLDEVFFKTKGLLSPPRLSRIERGLSKPTPAETAALTRLLGVSADVVDSAPVFTEISHVPAEPATLAEVAVR
jgi:transcriptional regulator with XRE-family HTH domain